MNLSTAISKLADRRSVRIFFLVALATLSMQLLKAQGTICKISATLPNVVSEAVDGYYNFGQSFTACGTGKLSVIRVLNSVAGNLYPRSNLTLTIRSGNGLSGAVLGTAIIPTSSLVVATSGTDFSSMDVSSLNIPVVSGQFYTFSFEGAVDNGIQLYYGKQVSPGVFESFYAGGRLYTGSTGHDIFDLVFEVDIVPASDPMPVRWISFSARLNREHKIVMDWKADESMVSHYEVERSANARDFRKVSTVTAHGDGVHQYSFTDPTTVYGIAYYRIRQLDTDGTFSYSRVLSVGGPEGIRLKAYPNPVKEGVTVEVDPQYVGSKIALSNTAGIMLKHIVVREPLFTIDMEGLAPGIYGLSTFDGKTKKLIKK